MHITDTEKLVAIVSSMGASIVHAFRKRNEKRGGEPPYIMGDDSDIRRVGRVPVASFSFLTRHAPKTWYCVSDSMFVTFDDVLLPSVAIAGPLGTPGPIGATGPVGATGPLGTPGATVNARVTVTSTSATAAGVAQALAGVHVKKRPTGP